MLYGASLCSTLHLNNVGIHVYSHKLVSKIFVAPFFASLMLYEIYIFFISDSALEHPQMWFFLFIFVQHRHISLSPYFSVIYLTREALDFFRPKDAKFLFFILLLEFTFTLVAPLLGIILEQVAYFDSPHGHLCSPDGSFRDPHNWQELFLSPR